MNFTNGFKCFFKRENKKINCHFLLKIVFGHLTDTVYLFTIKSFKTSINEIYTGIDVFQKKLIGFYMPSYSYCLVSHFIAFLHSKHHMIYC